MADKSLLTTTDNRYRMLDTIRAFCTTHLDPDHTHHLHHTHATYYLHLAQTADPHLRTTHQLHWLTQLDTDYPNLHTALRWTIDHNTTLALQLISALSMYWWLRGRSDSSTLSYQLALKLGSEPPEGLEEEYVLCVLNAAFGMADHEPLRAQLATLDRLAKARTGPPAQPFLTMFWALRSGPPDDGELLSGQPEKLLGADPWSQAMVPLSEGFMAVFQGDLIEAERRFTAALRQFRAIGERWGMSQVIGELAPIAGQRGDRERALALFDEGIELTTELGATEETADLLARRGGYRMRTGDLDGAEQDYQRSAELAGRAGAPTQLGTAHLGLGDLARLRGELTEARALYTRVADECPPGLFNTDLVRVYLWISLGRLAEVEGEPAEARRWLRQAADFAAGKDFLDLHAVVLLALAGVAVAGGDPARAARLLGAGDALSGAPSIADPDVTRVSDLARTHLGDAAFDAAYAEGLALNRAEALALADSVLGG
ncbi:tetratricopeptide repeat protein [Amycolatopsis nigrescens]|uniref:tetratricopeptide repeat protein n=1 Tax=Amycolatopsis nigrescens TaxID=381445 RepID=UPI00068400E5|nr:tetratricopeptide repeat protein [Amycolatopsis nigrescens]